MTGNLRLLSGRKLKSPQRQGTRPTVSRVREAVMNLLRESLSNSRWLDLCSGSGVMGCEALERGAKAIIAIESDYKTAQICKENLVKTSAGLSHQNYVKVIRSDVLKWLKSNSLENSKINSTDLNRSLAFLPYFFISLSIFFLRFSAKYSVWL